MVTYTRGCQNVFIKTVADIKACSDVLKPEKHYLLQKKSSKDEKWCVVRLQHASKSPLHGGTNEAWWVLGETESNKLNISAVGSPATNLNLMALIVAKGLLIVTGHFYTKLGLNKEEINLFLMSVHARYE